MKAVPEAAPVKAMAQQKFRFRVPASNTGHHPAANFRRNNINH
jgi:hypothetical protein